MDVLSTIKNPSPVLSGHPLPKGEEELYICKQIKL